MKVYCFWCGTLMNEERKGRFVCPECRKIIEIDGDTDKDVVIGEPKTFFG